MLTARKGNLLWRISIVSINRAVILALFHPELLCFIISIRRPTIPLFVIISVYQPVWLWDYWPAGDAASHNSSTAFGIWRTKPENKYFGQYNSLSPFVLMTYQLLIMHPYVYTLPTSIFLLQKKISKYFPRTLTVSLQLFQWGRHRSRQEALVCSEVNSKTQSRTQVS